MPFNMGDTTYAQGVDEISSARQLPLGTLRYYADAFYVYSQNTSAVDLRQGEILIDDPCNSDDDYEWDDVDTNAAAERGPGIGEYAIRQVLDVKSGENSATKAAGFYSGMWMFVDDGDGEGQAARIAGNTAAVSGSAFKIYLQTALATALGTSSDSDVTVIPENIVTEAAASTLLQRVVGVAPMAVTASYYFWRQVSDIAFVIDGTATPAAALELMGPGDGTAGQALAIAGGATVDDVTEFGSVVVASPLDGKISTVRLNWIL